VVAPHFIVSIWRTFFLGLAALGLGTFIYFVERPKIERESAPDPVLAFAPEEVRGVTLRYPGEPEIALERDENDWRLRAPIEFVADATTVERLVQQIIDTKVERRIAMSDAEDLGVYGLDEDGKQGRVIITMKDGTSQPALVVGGTTPVGYSAFARLEGQEEVLVIPLLLHTGVRKSVFDLRDKVLFDVDTPNVTSLRLERESRSLQMERRGDEWWILDENGDVRGDADQARALIAQLNTIRALEFFDDPVAGGDGTASPVLTFTAIAASGDTVGFALGRAVGEPGTGYYLRRLSDGLVVRVEDAVRVQYTKDRADLRDKRLFRCAAEAVGEIRFDRADGSGFALRRSNAGWAVTPADSGETTRAKIADRTAVGLANLAGNEIVTETGSDAEALTAFGLATPTVEVELFDRDGASCGRAAAGVVGAESDTAAYYVKRTGEPVVLSLPAYLFSRLDVRRGDLVVTPPAGDAASD
jgi:hypothetical protein